MSILVAYGELAGAWVAGINDTNQFIEVDMETAMKFTQVHIQGREDADEWVTSFKIYFYNSSISSWVEYIDGTGQNVGILFTSFN